MDNDKKIIIPTVGRQVWYHPQPGDSLFAEDRKPLAATVCWVHGERLVNLQVLDRNGNAVQRTSVTLLQPDDGAQTASYCAWMPYQIGQAAKTAEAEARVPEARHVNGVNLAPRFDFGLALHVLKSGERVGRQGWNGKGLWLELQVPDEHSKMTLPYIFMSYPKDAQNTPGARVPWLASQTDMLAEDWIVVL